MGKNTQLLGWFFVLKFTNMENLRAILATATIRILKPLVKILMRHEISHREFTEMAKQAYIDVAYADFSIPSRKTTYSRVAVLTGLSRKEVMRLANSEEQAVPKITRSANRAAFVIAGWLRDHDFLNAEGRPNVLSLKGEQTSFSDLVTRYGGNVTMRAVLDELLRIDAVDMPDSNSVRLISAGYIPQHDQAQKIDVLSMCAADLLDTAVFNLDHDADSARFQRQVIYKSLPEKLVEPFKHYSNKKSLELLLDYNHWLAEQAKQVSVSENEATKEVGVGIYYFEKDPQGRIEK